MEKFKMIELFTISVALICLTILFVNAILDDIEE